MSKTLSAVFLINGLRYWSQSTGLKFQTHSWCRFMQVMTYWTQVTTDCLIDGGG